MAHLAKLTVLWTGFIGAPGFTNLYFRNATPGTIDQAVVNDAVIKVDNFLTALQSRLPASVTVQTDATVEIIDDVNGQLQGFMQGVPAAAKVGTGTGNYSAASGAVANWYTGTVRNGRRIRGRSFLVPLAGSALAVDGTIDNTQIVALRTAATALHGATGASRFVVWGRPNNVALDNGVSAEVITSTVPDKAAILTSRRD